MLGYVLVFPDHFVEDAALIEAKGWFDGALIEAGAVRYRPVFYDPTRFAQTIADEVAADGHSTPEDVVVVPEVTRAAIEAAVNRLSVRDFAPLRALPD